MGLTAANSEKSALPIKNITSQQAKDPHRNGQ